MLARGGWGVKRGDGEGGRGAGDSGMVRGAGFEPTDKP
jgi:hypothetical protein